MSLSSLNTRQLVILSGMDSQNIISIENLLGLNFSDGISFDATLAKSSALTFCNMRIGIMLNVVRWLIKS